MRDGLAGHNGHVLPHADGGRFTVAGQYLGVGHHAGVAVAGQCVDGDLPQQVGTCQGAERQPRAAGLAAVGQPAYPRSRSGAQLVNFPDKAQVVVVGQSHFSHQHVNQGGLDGLVQLGQQRQPLAVIFLGAALKYQRIGGVVDHHALAAAAARAAPAAGWRCCAANRRVGGQITQTSTCCTDPGGRGTDTADQVIERPGQFLRVGVFDRVGEVGVAGLHGGQLVEFTHPVERMRHDFAVTAQNQHRVDRGDAVYDDGLAATGCVADGIAFQAQHFRQTFGEFVCAPVTGHHTGGVLCPHAGLVEHLNKFQRNAHVVGLAADQ